MWMNFAGDLATAGLGASSGALSEGAVGYLTASVLAPLSWMFVVEVCRRYQISTDGERKRVPLSAASRLAVPITNLTKRARSRWFENLEES
jgi:hypothetical protein